MFPLINHLNAGIRMQPARFNHLTYPQIALVSRLLPFLLLLLIVIMPGCNKDDDQPPILPTDQVTATIGPAGATVVVNEQITVFVPENAMSQTKELTFSVYNPEAYFDWDVENHFVIGCEPDGEVFAKPVELFITAPTRFQTGDIGGLAGLIDPESGALEVYPTAGLTIEGKNTIKLETTHFSKYGGYFWEYPPYQASMLEIPHYNQGDSPYCWAVCMHMTCEAIQRDGLYEIHDIIGYNGISEAGIGQYQFRFSSKIASYYKGRTGVNPDRKIWPWGSAYAMDSYIKDRIALGYPVIVFSPVEEHAFVVVGYEGNTFYINNPASVDYDGQLIYTPKTWAEFQIGEMDFNAKFVTVSVPKPIHQSGKLQSINITDHALSFDEVKQGSTVTNSYQFRYDYQKAAGYSFKDKSGAVFDTIPGSVTNLNITEIQLANASRTESKQVNVWIEVYGQDNNKIHKSFVTQQPINLPPNSLKFFTKKIPIADFADPTPGVSYYKLQATAIDVSTGVLDQAFIYFYLASAPSTVEFGCNYQVEYDDGYFGSIAIEGEEEGSLITLQGNWIGDTYEASAKENWEGLLVHRKLKIACNAGKTKALTLTYQIDVDDIESLVLEAENINLALAGNSYVIDLTDLEACDPVTEFYSDDFLWGAIVDFFCDETSYLKVNIPK